MKHFITIGLILITLISCENENPVSLKKIINNDSLYISHVIPESGIPNQLIQIYGKGFGIDTNLTHVLFDKTVAWIYKINDTSISVKVPCGDTGFIPIIVKKGNLQTQSQKLFEIKNLTVENIDPIRTNSGAEIRIDLINYYSIKPTEVYINSIQAKITKQDTNYLIVKVPNLAPGFYDVKVVSNCQTAISKQQIEIFDPNKPKTLIIKNVFPLKVSPEDTLFVQIINDGVKESEVEFLLGRTKIEIINFSDTLVILKIPSNLVNGNYLLSVKGKDFTSTCQDIIIFSKSYFNFSKIELWFNNFICNHHYNEQYSTFPPTDNYSFDTTYNSLVKSAYFTFNRYNIPKSIVFLDSSNKDTVDLIEFPTDYEKVKAESFYFIIDKINMKILNIETSNYNIIEFGYPHESTRAYFKLNEAKFVINSKNEFECSLNSSDLQNCILDFSGKYNFYYTFSHTWHEKYSDTKYLSLTDSSSVRIVLTPE